jgi:hypothetical protein
MSCLYGVGCIAAPDARFIATHMDAVNHACLSRAGLSRFLGERGLASRFSIPEDGDFAVL